MALIFLPPFVFQNGTRVSFHSQNLIKDFGNFKRQPLKWMYSQTAEPDTSAICVQRFDADHEWSENVLQFTRPVFRNSLRPSTMQGTKSRNSFVTSQALACDLLSYYESSTNSLLGWLVFYLINTLFPLRKEVGADAVMSTNGRDKKSVCSPPDFQGSTKVHPDTSKT
jgi:hypothetical protein